MTRIFDPPVEYSTQRTGSLIAHRSAQVFKHNIDTRSENTEIRSRNGIPHEALAVSTSEEPAAATATRCPRACSSTGSLEYSEPW
jgi:hypothetical protein